MQGRYKVKSADLKPLYERASKMARQLRYFAIEHVRRELNRDADALANVALDSAGVPKFERGASKPEVRTTAAETTPAAAPRQIRARFVNGVLVPDEPLDLPEGTEITVEYRKLRED